MCGLSVRTGTIARVDEYNGQPVRPFASDEEFLTWLDANHETSTGLWIKFAKRDSGIPSVYYAQALDVALCYGWIDGQAKSLDDSYYLQRFTPRTTRSRWSKINRTKVAALIEAGRMTPAGQRAIDAAKADGRWDAAYDSPRTATVPDDLRAALDADPEAAAFFETLSSQNRYAILHRTAEAKRTETRAKRIAMFVDMLARHETIHPQKRS